MANKLYEYWFIQFQFPNKDGEPYKNNFGKMKYSTLLKKDIPAGWDVLTVESVLSKTPKTSKISKSSYGDIGKFPIIDQSSDFIAGFTDDETAVLESDNGYIIFGDHTRNVKFVTFPFARGADGTQLLSSNTERLPMELLYHTINHIDLSNRGYARHFKFLKSSLIIVPDEETAKQFSNIVSKWHLEQEHCILENLNLSNLRDWLLPMLMNGQVLVDD